VKIDSLKALLNNAKDSVSSIKLKITLKKQEIVDSLPAQKKKKLNNELADLNKKLGKAEEKVTELEKKVKDAGKQH